jgi:hypothetical protein
MSLALDLMHIRGKHTLMDRPSIFSYGNYRSFLHDFICYLRNRGSYSNRAFARKAGFKSHTFVNLILPSRVLLP